MRHSALPGAVGALERSKDNAIWGRTSLCSGFMHMVVVRFIAPLYLADVTGSTMPSQF